MSCSTLWCVQNWTKDDTILNISLIQETFNLEQIEVLANQEDPAYEIIRNAIREKNNYKLVNQSYSANLYVKGVVKIVDAPESFMGVDIGDMDGIIDSNKQGILYLSETQSEIFRANDQTKEILKSSILAGEDNGIGFNQFMFVFSLDFSRSISAQVDYRFSLMNWL